MTNNLPRIIFRLTPISSNSTVIVFQLLPNHVYLSKTTNPRALISNRINFRSSGEHTQQTHTHYLQEEIANRYNESRGIW